MTTVMAVAKAEMPPSCTGNITEKSHCVYVMWHKGNDLVVVGEAAKTNAI